MRNIRRPALAALALFALAAPSQAQTLVYSDDFEGRRPDWRSHGLWATDGTPASAPGGAAASGQRSLNFNDGATYAGQQRGSTASPTIALAPGALATVRFRCNYQTETTGARWDRRSVLLLIDSTVVGEHQLAGARSTPAERRCGPMGTWHSHELRLPVPATSQGQLRIELVFDSVDDVANDFAGWFVDDVEVLQSAAPLPAVFDQVRRTTLDFRQLSTTLEVDRDGAARVLRSSPTARYAPVSGRATPAELDALFDAVRAANLASVPASIPDPNVYIVAPTTFDLAIDSGVPPLRGRTSGSLGVYGQWAGQVAPVMDALATIEGRLLAGGAQGDDHGDTAQAATPLDLDPAAAPTPGAIDPAGDVDVFRVAEAGPVIAIFPPPTATYTVETTVVGSMDTVLELRAEDGTLLATNDDGGAGLASRIEYTATLGAALYAHVRHYSSGGTGSYTVRATSASGPPPGPADDHGDSAQTATPLSVNGPALAGSIEVGGDADWFQPQQIIPMIFPPPTYTYVIETSVVGAMDTVVEVYAPDGVTLLASNDDAPGLGYASKVTLTVQAGAIGYVKVRHYGASGSGDYTLSITTQ
jgi:hypothetical protein